MIDSIEALVRLSAIVLLARRWEEEEPPEISSKLFRPSLGQWVEILRGLVAGPIQTELEESIKQFWIRLPHQLPLSLIDESKDSGINWKGQTPRNHLHWLDWFVWLRNTTRGHGSIEEEIAGNLWHGFHETFLYLVVGLKELVIKSTFERQAGNDIWVALKGWQRSNVPEESASNVPGSHLFLTPNLPEATSILIFPLAIEQSRSILLWNNIRGKSVEYLDYGSGQLTTVTYSMTDAHGLWENSVRLLIQE